jgi:hypothetical protein
VTQSRIDIKNITIASVISLFISAYFYVISQPVRKLTMFGEGHALEEYIDLERSGIKLTQKNGKPILNRVSFLNYYFWNSGNTPIRKEDILKPLVLKIINNPKAKIIDARITSTSRNVVNPVIVLGSDAQSITVNYAILEKNDGFKISLIISTPSSYSVAPSSTIIGAPELSTQAPGEAVNWFKLVFLYCLFLVFWINLMNVVVYYYELKPEVRSSSITKIGIIDIFNMLLFPFFVFGIPLIFVLFFFVYIEIGNKNVLYDAIPDSIKTEKQK